MIQTNAPARPAGQTDLVYVVTDWKSHADMGGDAMEQYKHPIHRELEEKAKEVGGHGGMVFIMDYRLVYCLQIGLPLHMDVYDLAEWCSLVPLTEISLDNGSMPVEIPDFTRGAWNKVQGLQFAY